MAQITGNPHYAGVWSKEGLAMSPMRTVSHGNSQRLISPRSRSRSVHTPHHQSPRPRFASGQRSPMRPIQLFHGTEEESTDYEFDWTSEDSAYFCDSPMVKGYRRESPSRNAPSWDYGYPPKPPKPPRNLKQERFSYFQLAINVVLACAAVWFATKLLETVNYDLKIKLERARADIIAEIEECRHAYEKNFCSNNKSPALVQVCAEWEACMNQDPDKVGHVRASADALGEIIESFVGPLDLRSMVFLLLVAFGILYFNQPSQIPRVFVQ